MGGGGGGGFTSLGGGAGGRWGPLLEGVNCGGGTGAGNDLWLLGGLNARLDDELCCLETGLLFLLWSL